ncbi:MAG TPA: trypsin-like peptidase domain-containing protein [Cyclobacteriaceae bacterium]|nr:trypsin-like peptidase domain-containing protein [Cyclobacteriaceae bacterium]
MKRTGILIVIIFLVTLMGGILGSIFTVKFLGDSIPAYESIEGRQRTALTHYTRDSAYNVPKEVNFLLASQHVVPAVVHIQTSYGSGSFSLNPLEMYYQPQERSSGSGVIISDDGYIVTNHHVIEEATNVEVIMNNNQRFYAKIVGTDPSTDLALLKIKARNLPFVPYGNSDAVNIGEWVLAVGNPFNLNSTVTAGIVSARARNIRILREKNNLQVESFIQTDAAVNPGNSGGALVNLKGELIGVNSAIATATGTYSGYSFAIPVSLVKKVMDDLLAYGQVQRGLLGVQITDVNAGIAEQLGLTVNDGVLITRVNTGSAAAEVNLQPGDVITAIDNHVVKSVSELQEWVARNRPGKEIKVTYLRANKVDVVKARLKDNEGREGTYKKEVRFAFNGMEVEDLLFNELAKRKIENGIRVKKIDEGKWKEAGIKEGFIISFMDRVPVDNVEDFNRMLEYKRGGILIEGYYEAGDKKVYALEW